MSGLAWGKTGTCPKGTSYIFETRRVFKNVGGTFGLLHEAVIDVGDAESDWAVFDRLKSAR